VHVLHGVVCCVWLYVCDVLICFCMISFAMLIIITDL